MANEIMQSLFGLTSYDAEQQLRQRQNAEDLAYAQLDPRQQILYNARQAGRGMASGINQLFGLVPEGLQRVRSREGALMQVNKLIQEGQLDPSDPEATTKALVGALSSAGDQQGAALVMMNYQQQLPAYLKATATKQHQQNRWEVLSKMANMEEIAKTSPESLPPGALSFASTMMGEFSRAIPDRETGQMIPGVDFSVSTPALYALVRQKPTTPAAAAPAPAAVQKVMGPSEAPLTDAPVTGSQPPAQVSTYPLPAPPLISGKPALDAATIGEGVPATGPLTQPSLAQINAIVGGKAELPRPPSKDVYEPNTRMENVTKALTEIDTTYGGKVKALEAQLAAQGYTPAKIREQVEQLWTEANNKKKTVIDTAQLSQGESKLALDAAQNAREERKYRDEQQDKANKIERQRQQTNVNLSHINYNLSETSKILYDSLTKGGLNFTTGSIGSLLSSFKMPSEAKQVANRLNSVVSALTVDELQNIRQNSPTGAALGNSSDKDIELLKNAVSTIDQSQDQIAVLNAMAQAQWLINNYKLVSENKQPMLEFNAPFQKVYKNQKPSKGSRYYIIENNIYSHDAYWAEVERRKGKK